MSRKYGLVYRICDFGADRFRRMVLGCTLWVVILFKLFIVFFRVSPESRLRIFRTDPL
ncbi:MAG: DUF4492 domain-containing protein [Prevotella sp.]